MNSLALIVFVCAIMIIVIAAYAWQQGKTEGARIFALLMISMSIYILGYSFELGSLDFSTMLFWNKIQYVGILSFPTIYLIFAGQFSGKQKWINKRNITFLFIIPIICLVIKTFDNSLHLIYHSVEVDYSGIIPLLSFQEGPVYYLASTYNLVMVTLGTFLLINKRSHASALYLRQTNIILAVSIVLYASYLIYLSGFTLFPHLKQLDLNPFVYTLWGFAISYAILRYRLFDLTPIARDALIEILGDAVLVLDDQFRLVDSNPKAQSLFEWEKTPVGATLDKLNLDIIDRELIQSLKNNYSYEKQILQNGQLFDYEVTVSILRGKQQIVVGFLMVLHDISSRKKVEKELQELSLVDDLTKLINRRGFFVLSEQLFNFCLRMKMNAALYFFDMDNLKLINDQFGHATGDQAIIDMGSILKKSFRSSDIVARFGGDEFVVLAIETKENSITSMSLRLEEYQKNFSSETKRKYKLAFSTGTSIFIWESPQPIDILLKKADLAMYEEKQSQKRTLHK